MIFIELTVPPHYADTRYTEESMRSGGPWVQTPDSKPPAIVFKKEFRTWDEARKFYEEMGFNGYGMKGFWDDSIKYEDWVDVEVELQEPTGTLFIAAGLHIEGKEE